MKKDLTLNDYLLEHCNESMTLALSIERYPSWKRICPELSDTDFAYMGLLRCLSVVDSGRDFLQKAGELYDEVLPHSTYFNALKSSRRNTMLEALERQSYLSKQ